MDIQHASPIMLRRRLRTALRTLRDERQLSQRDVAAALDWAPSKLHRLESGETGITVVDLRSLLAYYNVTDPAQIQNLIQIARYARRQLYGGYSDILSAPLLTWLQYEGAASTIRSFEPVLVPGLLQTEEYTTALMRLHPVPSDTEEVLARRV
ncbi:Scr1 family TA system antitoxin-like transcriptional regulator [Catenuloplanes indicus]|uniref:Transcriptional regulator with XRE-family HTH domain n=1 Tax=Catenuloplanes indicus TaxID=137267 RepID=A0AAE4B2T5_9ACTN|nr:Scr1 family TA system antitoxin-like transcriptional regulator [Catenuloplanes indicus]MDQ0371026.1 transcriptional regulator with XRE-family HTH domain [Catenuloplanes indicus]